MSFLSELIGQEGLPTLMAHGLLPGAIARGVSHFLVIKPVGQLLGDDLGPELVQSAFRDIASVLMELLARGILHRYVKGKMRHCF